MGRLNFKPEPVAKPENLIQEQADDFYRRKINPDDYQNSIFDLRYQLPEYHKLSYRIEFIERIRYRTKKDSDDHSEVCMDPERCSETKGYKHLLFFINEELEEQRRYLPETEFSEVEKQKMSDAIPQMLETLQILKTSHEFTYNDMIEEFTKLRELLFLDKKTWTQVALGKLSEMVIGGVVSEAVANQILEGLKESYIGFIK